MLLKFFQTQKKRPNLLSLLKLLRLSRENRPIQQSKLRQRSQLQGRQRYRRSPRLTANRPKLLASKSQGLSKRKPRRMIVQVGQKKPRWTERLWRRSRRRREKRRKKTGAGLRKKEPRRGNPLWRKRTESGKINLTSWRNCWNKTIDNEHVYKVVDWDWTAWKLQVYVRSVHMVVFSRSSIQSVLQCKKMYFVLCPMDSECGATFEGMPAISMIRWTSVI